VINANTQIKSDVKEMLILNNLDEKGFVFLDDNGNPYRCAMLGGQAWLFYLEVTRFPRNLPQKHQDMYFTN
jgi:hypothetical protein